MSDGRSKLEQSGAKTSQRASPTPEPPQAPYTPTDLLTCDLNTVYLGLSVQKWHLENSPAIMLKAQRCTQIRHPVLFNEGPLQSNLDEFALNNC